MPYHIFQLSKISTSETFTIYSNCLFKYLIPYNIFKIFHKS